jgi:hypothetical protein
VALGGYRGQSEHDLPVQDPTSHITNTGRIIEDMEIKMRGLLQEVSSFALFSPLLLLSGLLWAAPSYRKAAPVSSFTFRDAQHRALAGLGTTAGDNLAYQVRSQQLHAMSLDSVVVISAVISGLNFVVAAMRLMLPPGNV